MILKEQAMPIVSVFLKESKSGSNNLLTNVVTGP